MLNSNFDLRTFMTESKNPTLSEGAKFKVGDMVKLSGGEPTEVLAVRKMTDSDLHAYSIKNSKGERAEYDETQLTAADVSEGEYKDKGQSAELNKERLQALKAKKAEMEKKGVPAGLIATVDKQIGELEKLVSEVLSEATVMEYIREKMDSMNNEVRSCMREYLNTCNEIDPSHEDAHAQLMGALEDFYSKLKAHFEADQAEDIPVAAAPVGTIGDEPLEEGEGEALYKIQTTTPDSEPTIQKLSKRGADDLEKSMDIVSIELVKEDDDEFGGEEDEVEEAKVKVDIPGQDSFEAEEGKEYSEEEADEYIANAKKSGATPMNTKFSKVNEEDGVTYPEDKHTLTPDELGHDVEEGINEAIDPETVDLLMGLAKSAVTMGTVPAALAVLYQFKDHPKIAKVVTAFEKHLDK